MVKARLTLFITGGLVSMIAGGILFASIPDAGGTITACYQKTTGALRVIDVGKGQSCLPTEALLSWNHLGVPGAPGAPGGSGTAGTNGVDGVSVTAQVLSPGDPNCPNGGAKFTAINGDTFACNGANGSSGNLQFNATMSGASPTTIDVGDGLLVQGCFHSVNTGLNYLKVTSAAGVDVLGGTYTDLAGAHDVLNVPTTPTEVDFPYLAGGLSGLDVVVASPASPNNYRRITMRATGTSSSCDIAGISIPVGAQ